LLRSAFYRDEAIPEKSPFPPLSSSFSNQPSPYLPIMIQGGYIYILTNGRNTVLFTGVTSNLPARIGQHRAGGYETSFAHKYHLTKLVYFCFFPTILEAIAEEKRIKGGSRARKMKLIDEMNPGWNDSWGDVKGW
jgi:putative endonuclease